MFSTPPRNHSSSRFVLPSLEHKNRYTSRCSNLKEDMGKFLTFLDDKNLKSRLRHGIIGLSDKINECLIDFLEDNPNRYSKLMSGVSLVENPELTIILSSRLFERCIDADGQEAVRFKRFHNGLKKIQLLNMDQDYES